MILKKWLFFINDLDKTSESFIPELENDRDIVLDNSSQARFVLSNMFSIFYLFFFYKVTLVYSNILFYSNFLHHGFFNVFLNSRRVIIKPKKNIFFYNRFFKYTKFKVKFGFNFLFKFKKISNFLKSKNLTNSITKNGFFKISFNFKKFPRLFFFYLKEYPLTGYFFNKSLFPLISSLDEISSNFGKNLNFHISRSRNGANNLLKLKDFKFFKKLITTKLGYLSKKKTFWNFYFKIKKFTINDPFFKIINSCDLPLSQVNLSVSSNYKKTFYNLDKMVFFSLELMIDAYHRSKTSYLSKKKRYKKKFYNPSSFYILAGEPFYLKKKKLLPDFFYASFFNKLTLFPSSFFLQDNLFKKKQFLNKARPYLKKKKISYSYYLYFNKINNTNFFKNILDKNFFFLTSSKQTIIRKYRIRRAARIKLLKSFYFNNFYGFDSFLKNARLKKKLKFFNFKKFSKAPMFFFLKRFVKRLFNKFTFFFLNKKLKKKKFFYKKSRFFFFKKRNKLFFLSTLRSEFFKKTNRLINLLFFYSKKKRFFRIKKKTFFIKKDRWGGFFSKNHAAFYKKQNKLIFSLQGFATPFTKINLPQYFYSNVGGRSYGDFYDFIFSRIDFVFTHSFEGFLYVYDKTEFEFLQIKYYYVIKKTSHSFIFKNDLQNFIIKKHLKSNFNPIFTNFNPTENLFFSTLFNTDWYPDIEYREDYFSRTHFSSFLNENCIFRNHDRSSYFEISSKFKWLANKNFISYLGFLNGIPFNFSIRKIKFKPGYQHIWREARECFKISLNLHFRYQARLTRYINRFKKIIRNNTSSVFENQLYNLFKLSKLVPDVNWSMTFIQNGSVFVNGMVSLNPFHQLFKNDFVQLIVNHAYYIFYKWVIVWSTLKKFRFKAKIDYKLSKKDLPDDKQKSRNSPLWVLRFRSFTDDIPKNFEVDYLSLSFFIIYDFHSLLEFDSIFSFQHRFPIINMHNWKYIN